MKYRKIGPREIHAHPNMEEAQLHLKRVLVADATQMTPQANTWIICWNISIHHILVTVVFLFTYCFIAICYVYRCLTPVSTLQRTSIFMLSHELVVRLFSYIYLYISLC